MSADTDYEDHTNDRPKLSAGSFIPAISALLNEWPPRQYKRAIDQLIEEQFVEWAMELINRPEIEIPQNMPAAELLTRRMCGSLTTSRLCLGDTAFYALVKIAARRAPNVEYGRWEKADRQAQLLALLATDV